MDLRMLETFVAVAEEGGFTRAAVRLHLVQSSVSASVASLERQLGFRLFDRRTRSVQLTAEGRSFLESARAAVDAFNRAREDAAKLGGGVAGTVAVGVLVIPDMLGVARAVTTLHAQHPGIDIIVRTATNGSEGLLGDIVAGDLDLSFVVLPLPFAHPPEIVFEPLVAGRYLLCCGRSHPWAGRTDDIPVEEFDGVDFVEFPHGFSTRRATDERFAHTQVRRRTHVEVAHLELVATYIAAGTGVGFVTENLVQASDALVPLTASWIDLRWSIAIARRRGRRVSGAASTFLDVVRENSRAAIATGTGLTPG
ncbi:LysR family transcriptional regulator [Pengzhenrongella sicca]|uniref:LysR family transcriptional regulator n=1 Tax=Pengzhenrongella sicca TaxID=2819238 RepID=A0A8A4ZCT8_9MICO|nr:LysR family transcriptional regulator [Pengzhenrongella sicca]QTE28839.1 LysR family transcriptional regulator [Pengzhenrongella sicca]